VGFRTTFPYLAQAQSGQSHIHKNPVLNFFVPFLSRVALSVGEVPGGRPAAGLASLTFAAVAVPAMVFLRRRKHGRPE
jgi:hypothetical protein